jgi:hypothetical protein
MGAMDLSSPVLPVFDLAWWLLRLPSSQSIEHHGIASAACPHVIGAMSQFSYSFIYIHLCIVAQPEDIVVSLN